MLNLKKIRVIANKILFYHMFYKDLLLHRVIILIISCDFSFFDIKLCVRLGAALFSFSQKIVEVLFYLNSKPIALLL